MDFEITKEQQELKKVIIKFAQNEPNKDMITRDEWVGTHGKTEPASGSDAFSPC